MMEIWLDFFLQAFVTALAWFSAALVFAALGAVFGWVGLIVLGATPKGRARR